MNDQQQRILDLAGRSGLSEEEKFEFDELAESFGKQGITLDYVEGRPILRAYDGQDDIENDIFPRIG